ncbi:MAG: hypothetical protein VZR13_08790 [Saccharofermentanaceae bacterium]|nr:hypothetical protein [Saccharofermentanaceae bacterium]
MFSNPPFVLEFVTDDSMLTITNDKGEKWEFPYETNKIFELDDGKRYVMLIEEKGYARLLASAFLAEKESARFSYPGLIPQFFRFVNAFDPDCIFEDRDGVVYTATVRKGKGECVFVEDAFHERVVALCAKMREILDDQPRGPHVSRGVISELEYMDRRGDPSRYMPDVLIEILEKHPVITFVEGDPKRNEELTRELNEIVEEYKILKRW